MEQATAKLTGCFSQTSEGGAIRIRRTPKAIPRSLNRMGKTILLTSQPTFTRVLLRNISYEIVANPILPIARAVNATDNDTIIMSFNIDALGTDEAPVIEVMKLFTTEVAEFSLNSYIDVHCIAPT